MLFNSFSFLVFFPVVVLVLFIIPRRFRSVWLLIASYWFYMSWNPKYAVLIGLSTVITYFSGIMIEKADTDRGRKAVVAFSLISNLGILALFKYANFVLDTVSAVCGRFGVSTGGMHLDLLLPVGISFYTFQALGYTLDVYRGTISSEKNIINYALFVSFFPQLVAGPIERSGNLLRQIRSIKELQLYEYAREHSYAFYCLTSSTQKDVDRWKGITGAEYPFCQTDGITLKTVIRSNPGMVLLKNGTIIRKWSHNDLPELSEAQASQPLEQLEIGQMPDNNVPKRIATLMLWFVLPLALLSLADRMWMWTSWLRRRKRQPSQSSQ